MTQEESKTRLRNACQQAFETFNKINEEKYAEIKSKLEYCIGSFDYDKNPQGLIEYGTIALNQLKAYKKQNPRKLNKKIIEALEKSLKRF